MVAGVQGVVGGNTMRFHLHRARDLTAADTNGSADPHVRVQILGVDGDVLHEQISAVKTTTREPYWNQDIDLGSHISMVDIESVRLVMLDYDGLSSSEYMGEVDLPLPAEFWTRNVPVLPRGWHHLVDTRKLNSSLKNRSRNRSRTITSDIGRGLQAITSGAVVSTCEHTTKQSAPIHHDLTLRVQVSICSALCHDALCPTWTHHIRRTCAIPRPKR